MSKRRVNRFNPGLERLEAKRPLSAAGATASITSAASEAVSPDRVKPLHGFLVFRITQPNIHNDTVTGPFGQVLVQSAQPVPGQVYNVLQIVVRNGTAQTFTAANGFTVHLTGQTTTTPVLTGNETWQPGQWFIFYVLTKKYYPLHDQVAGGFEFDLGNAKSVAVPGPSAIFLRVTYDPAKFPSTLDWIVTHGPGAEGGAGIKFGMPVTSLNEILPSVTARHDFGGYF